MTGEKSEPSRLPGPAGVDLWRGDLDAGDTDLERLRTLLTPSERARADGFAFDRERRRSAASRGLLRTLLARYTKADPRNLVIETGDHGKPRLGGQGDLRFNVAHSGATWLCAVVRGREVGVDLEEVREDPGHPAMAERYFSANESRTLAALPAKERTSAFFRCWTRKEAFLKAKGFGLALPLDAFDVSLAPGDPPAVLATRFDPPEASRWSLLDLDLGPALAAALALASQPDP